MNPDDLPLWSAPFGLKLLDTVRFVPGINILDIGSGTGFPMLEIAERSGSTCMTYGLEPDGEMLSIGRAKQESRNILNARLLKAYAEDIPFPDKYFGLITSNNGLNNVVNLETALSECRRVADDGARMVITVNLPGTMNLFYKVFRQSLDAIAPGNSGKIDEHILAKRKTAEFWKTVLPRYGFGIISQAEDCFMMRYSDGTSFLHNSFIRASFFPAWNAIPPTEVGNKVFGVVEQELNRVASTEGCLAMEIPYICIECIKT